MRSKSLFLVVSLILLSCKTTGNIPVKVYVSKPDKGGIYRKQENEIITYDKTDGYFCMSGPDFEVLLKWCQPKEDGISEHSSSQNIQDMDVEEDPR